MGILGSHRLTPRRRECLAALRRAVAAAGGPVHYSTLASDLGISPWTAYDLLRELEGLGLVRAAYAHRPGVVVGRTQVAFGPTDAGLDAIGAERAPSSEERALRRARALAARVPGGIVAARSAIGRTARGVDLAGHLGFWLHQADALSARTRAGLRHLLAGAPQPDAALTTFVAAVYGALAPGVSPEVNDALVAEVADFQRRLARTTAARRDRLARSLARLLEHAPAPTHPPGRRSHAAG